MTEQEWHTCVDPNEMLYALDRLRFHPTERKCRLCSVAFCLRLKPSLLHEQSRTALEIAARFADGLASENEREAAHRNAASVGASSPILHTVAWDQSLDDVIYAAESVWGGLLETADEQAIQVRLIHDIFGNPFRPVAADPAWLASTVVILAQQMYESRDFSAMPILADAFQDAGCENPDVLDHCRDPKAIHVRGCWVVDAIVGKG